MSGSAHCTLSHNSYCYCCSNPVKNIDPNGEFLNCILGGVIGGLVGGIVSGVDALLEGKTVEEALDSAVSGAISGAVSGAVAGLFADVAIATGGVGGIALAAAGGALTSAGSNIYSAVSSGEPIDPMSLVVDTVVGAGFNTLTYFVGGGGLAKRFEKLFDGKIFDNLCKDFFSSVWKHSTQKVANHCHLNRRDVAQLSTWLLKSLSEEAAICTVITGGTVLVQEVMSNNLGVE